MINLFPKYKNSVQLIVIWLWKNNNTELKSDQQMWGLQHWDKHDYKIQSVKCSFLVQAVPVPNFLYFIKAGSHC